MKTMNKRLLAHLQPALWALLFSLLLGVSACSTVPKQTGAASGAPAGNDWLLGRQETRARRRPFPEDAGRYAGADHDDVWLRLREGLSLDELQHPRISERMDWYSDRPELLSAVSERAEPYLYHIAEEVERRKLPAEVALVPAVESAFQPAAYSPAHASGLWQFIPSTGRIYGLKQTRWYDGRRDVLDSTDAALDYLTKLNREFKGDWLLTFAAYNAGEGAVQRAIERNQRLGRATDFWSLSLPAETRDYVPRILALSHLLADADKHVGRFAPVANTPYFDTIELDAPMDLRLAANLAGTDLAEMNRLNPGLKRGVTDPAGPHRLVVPVDRKEAFQQKLAQLPPGERGARYAQEEQSLQVEARRAARGDAEGTTTRKLHVVARGESLWAIARRHNVTPAQLAQWNGLKVKAPLHAGQTLKLAATPDGHGDPRTIRYTVRRGDTLGEISERFKVSLADLKRWNPQSRARSLKPGQTLKLHLAAS
jgi:membrane-bound lytic murein transglycosylase D